MPQYPKQFIYLLSNFNARLFSFFNPLRIKEKDWGLTYFLDQSPQGLVATFLVLVKSNVKEMSYQDTPLYTSWVGRFLSLRFFSYLGAETRIERVSRVYEALILPLEHSAIFLNYTQNQPHNWIFTLRIGIYCYQLLSDWRDKSEP